MSVKEMIHSGASIEEIGEILDGMTHGERLRELHSLSPRDMAALNRLAGEGPPVEMVHFVPAGKPELVEVVHHGMNSLPAFRKFQKRFCRSMDSEGKPAVYGYNEGFTRPFVGPGYFVTHPTAGKLDWEERGALVIDYLLEPDGPVANGWPKFVPNSHGLQQLVYYRTRDFMRRVSNHGSIGAAFKGGKAMNVYFILCRED